MAVNMKDSPKSDNDIVAPEKESRKARRPTPTKKQLEMSDIKIKEKSSDDIAGKLDTIITILKTKNTPTTQKEATALKRQTASVANEAQKTGSEAFKKEANEAVKEPVTIKSKEAKKEQPIIKEKAATAPEIEESPERKAAREKAKAESLVEENKPKVKVFTPEQIDRAHGQAIAENERREKSKAYQERLARNKEEKLNRAHEQAIIENERREKLKANQEQAAIAEKERIEKAKATQERIAKNKEEKRQEKINNAHARALRDNEKFDEEREAAKKAPQIEEAKKEKARIAEEQSYAEAHEEALRKNAEFDKKKEKADRVAKERAERTKAREEAKQKREQEQQQKKADRNDPAKIKEQEIAKESARLIRVKLREEEKNRVAKQKAEEKAKQAKIKETADKADKFNGSVMDSVYEANPLLKFGKNVFSGLKTNYDAHKDRQAAKQTEEKQDEGDSKLTPVPAEGAKLSKDVAETSQLSSVAEKQHDNTINASSEKKEENKVLTKLNTMISSLVKSIGRIGNLISSLTKGIASFVKKSSNQLVTKTKSSLFGNDKNDSDDKESLLKRTKNKFGKKKTLSNANSEGSGGSISGAVEGEGVEAAVGGAEAVGGAVEGAGLLVGLSELIAPVLAGIAALVAVVGVGMGIKSLFGGDDDKDKAKAIEAGAPAVISQQKENQANTLAIKKAEIEAMKESENKRLNAPINVVTDNSVKTTVAGSTVVDTLTSRNTDCVLQPFGYGKLAF